jgi:hypothetical protein
MIVASKTCNKMDPEPGSRYGSGLARPDKRWEASKIIFPPEMVVRSSSSVIPLLISQINIAFREKKMLNDDFNEKRFYLTTDSLARLKSNFRVV